MAEPDYERRRALSEELVVVLAAATSTQDRDYRAWARVIEIRHELGQGVSNYALWCAREARKAESGGANGVAGPFRAPPERLATGTADAMPDEDLPPIEAYEVDA